MSFWRHYYHLVWATNDREPLIQPNIEERLRAYIVSKSVEQTVVGQSPFWCICPWICSRMNPRLVREAR